MTVYLMFLIKRVLVARLHMEYNARIFLNGSGFKVPSEFLM